MSLALVSLAVLSTVQAAPNPDFSVQPGDEGAYHHGEEDHHHDHEHPHENQDLEVPPPPPPSVDSKKVCKLMFSPTPISKECFNEPECSTECKQVPQKECKPITQQKCEELNVTACNTIQEEVCQTNYAIQYENQCKIEYKEQCSTRYFLYLLLLIFFLFHCLLFNY